MHETRTRRLAEVLEWCDLADECHEPTANDDCNLRFVLVELDSTTGFHWVTLHASIDAAVAYIEKHDGEYTPDKLVNLDTGEEFFPVIRYEFHKAGS